MARCPSQDWDDHIRSQDDACEAEMSADARAVTDFIIDEDGVITPATNHVLISFKTIDQSKRFHALLAKAVGRD